LLASVGIIKFHITGTHSNLDVRKIIKSLKIGEREREREKKERFSVQI
jgi:hypothetical protein